MVNLNMILKDEPLELTKSKIGHLDISVRIEVVLGEYIMPCEREIKEPFSKFPGSYSGARSQQSSKPNF